jgi:hypothetical protein
MIALLQWYFERLSPQGAEYPFARAQSCAVHSQMEKFPRLWPNRYSAASGWGDSLPPLTTSKGLCLRMLRDSFYFLFSLPWVVIVLGWLLFVTLAA